MKLESLFSLKGKTALVAGAGGLGIGMAEGFAKAGADVVLADKSAENTARGAKIVRDCGTKALELNFDIYDRDSIVQMVEDALKFSGRIDILANSVGISRMGHAEDLSVDDWQAVTNAFLSGVFYTCQLVGQKAMIPQKYGKIINIASISGMVVTGDMGSSYCTAKAGVIQLSKALATEWCKYGINVNCISPGYMLTALTENFLVGDLLEHFLKGIPKGRIGQPEDMAGAAVFLASESSEYIIGQNLVIDGGYIAH
jgi:2-dehydro-3-deoxy-D-gluconate 5-dehydrogenase